MWDTLNNSLDSIRAQAESSRQTWGVAIGALVAFLTEGLRFVRNETDRYTDRITKAEEKIKVLEKAIGTVGGVAPLSPFTPTAPGTVPTLSLIGPDVNVVMDPSVPPTAYYCRIIVTTTGVGTNPEQIATLNFGGTWIKPPVVQVNPVGPSSGDNTPFLIYGDVPGQTSVALLSDGFDTGSTRKFDISVAPKYAPVAL